MNDEFGDQLKASHDRPFMLNANVLKIDMPFRLQIRCSCLPVEFFASVVMFCFVNSGASGMYSDALFMEVALVV